MKAFVTGGTGFIGQHVVRKLVERGYEVHALARSSQSAAQLSELGAIPVPGDITDAASMRDAMQGSDVVFHIAASYRIGASYRESMDAINVGGTRKVLRLAHELGVPKIVYTSTVGVFGDTEGELVDETYFSDGPFASEYERTKWLAHYKVALPLIEKGAPITIVMPGAVYGPGDTSMLAEVMRMFYRGFPTVPGPGSTVTYAHVEDIAEGHVLAAEQGRVGESYILAGPAVPLGEMMDFWAYLTGKSAPRVGVPAPLVRASAPLLSAAGSFSDLKQAFSAEGAMVAGRTYMARSDKARRELGWETRPLQTGMLETFEWIAETESEREPAATAQRRRLLAGLALGTAAVVLTGWLLTRRRQV